MFVGWCADVLGPGDFLETCYSEDPSRRIDEDALVAADIDGPAHTRQKMAALGAIDCIVRAGVSLRLFLFFG